MKYSFTIRLTTAVSLSLLGFTTIFPASLLFAEPNPPAPTPSEAEPITEAKAALETIGKAYLSMASGDRPRSPIGKTIHEIAAYIAQYGDLNKAAVWVLPRDPMVKEVLVNRPAFPSQVADKPALVGDRWTVNNYFQAFPLAFAFANKTPSNAMSSTPVAWTRGLKSDGTWDKSLSPLGESAGLVLFRDGSIKVFRGNELARNGGGLVNYKTRQPTTNILEAIHPFANVLESK